MKIAFFDAKPYDKPAFDKYGNEAESDSNISKQNLMKIQ